MKCVRNLGVWLGAPLLASLLCTMGWHLLAGGRMEWSTVPDGSMANFRIAVSIGIGSLIFTIGGSTLLSFLFAGMSARSIAHRYVLLMGFGGLAGGATMLFLGGPPVALAAGVIYGTVTGCFWVGLHKASAEHDRAA